MTDVFSPPLWVWAVTVGAILVLVVVDIIHARSPHEVSFREATQWSVAYIAAAVAFGVILLFTAGGDVGLQYFSGWLIEKSLSVDNLFVFAVILSSFAVPAKHQQRVLLFGVLGALILRVVFIAIGAAAIERFAVTFVFFGLFLIYTAVQLVRSHGETPDVQNNKALKLVRRFVRITEEYDDDGRLTTRVDGKRAATPLLAVTIVILSVDIVFALDSIPAIFGITSSPYLVVTANAFALLGLRALYFLLVGLLDRLVYLSYGLAIILAFIGVKLILHYLHTDVSTAIPEISTPLSLAVVIGVLAITTILSLRKSRGGAGHGGALGGGGHGTGGHGADDAGTDPATDSEAAAGAAAPADSPAPAGGTDGDRVGGGSRIAGGSTTGATPRG